MLQTDNYAINTRVKEKQKNKKNIQRTVFRFIIYTTESYTVLFESPKNHPRTTPKKYNTNSDTKCSVSLHHTHKVINNIIVVSGS